VVLDLHRLVSMDTSGLDALRQLQHSLRRRGTALVLVRVNEQPLSLIRRSGFADELGAGGILDAWPGLDG
jgi:SulP family sulfate permease